MSTKDKKLNVWYAFILGAYWMIFAVSSIFVVPLLRLRGFDDSQIGLLIAIRSVSAICVSPVIATFSDRHRTFQIKNILMILLLINITNTCIFQFCELNYPATVLSFIILGASTNTMPPLHSSIAMKFNENGRNLIYSIGRGTGSICYAIVSLLLGQFVSSDNYSASLYIQIGLDIFSLICIFFFPKYRTGEDELAMKSGTQEDEVHSIGYLLKQYPNFMLFLIASVLVFVGYCMCNSFMIDIIISRGGDNADMGISCFILGAAELPTAILFPVLRKKFGTKRLLEISAVFALMKMVFLYLSRNVIAIFFSQTLQMLGNGMYWPTSVYYVNEAISGKDQVKGQSLANIASVNVGAVLGSVVSGKLLSYFDIDAVILFGCGCSFVGVIFMFLSTRLKLKAGEKRVV
ncbi:MAG: MFS transporter, partial [Lachnospiraceae bacterium]|nr:MFS transporter [Lachnospiraceae bacterium]